MDHLRRDLRLPLLVAAVDTVGWGWVGKEDLLINEEALLLVAIWHPPVESR